MKRVLLPLLVAGALLVTGCASAKGEPKAVISPATHDFGDVPVTNDMSKAVLKTFAIKNEGTGDLKITGLEMKLLDGC